MAGGPWRSTRSVVGLGPHMARPAFVCLCLCLCLCLLPPSSAPPPPPTEDGKCPNFAFVKDPLHFSFAPSNVSLVEAAIGVRYKVLLTALAGHDYDDAIILYALRHWTAVVGLSPASGKLVFAFNHGLEKNPHPGKLWAKRITVCRHLNGTTLLCSLEGDWSGAATLLLYDYATGRARTVALRSPRLAVLHHDLRIDQRSSTIMLLSQSRVRVSYKGEECSIVDLTTLTAVNLSGTVVWTMDLHPFLWPLFVKNLLPKPGYKCQNRPCDCRNAGQAGDFFHANNINWDVEEDALYISFRHIGTFAKVSRRNRTVEWLIGHLNGFRFYDAENVSQPYGFLSLHEVTKVGHNRFLLFDNNRDSWGFALPRTQPKAARGNLGSCVRDVTVDPGSGVVREHSAWCFPNVCKAMGYSQPLPGGRTLGHHTYARETAVRDQEGRLLLRVRLPRISSAFSYRAQLFFLRPQVTAAVRGCAVSLTVYDYAYRTYHVPGVIAIQVNGTELPRKHFHLKPYWQPTVVEVPLTPTLRMASTFVITVDVEGTPHRTVLRAFRAADAW